MDRSAFQLALSFCLQRCKAVAPPSRQNAYPGLAALDALDKLRAVQIQGCALVDQILDSRRKSQALGALLGEWVGGLCTLLGCSDTGTTLLFAQVLNSGTLQGCLLGLITNAEAQLAAPAEA